MLLNVVACCCTKFESDQTFSPVQTDATLLRPFAQVELWWNVNDTIVGLPTEVVAIKKGESHATTKSWIRIRVSFALLRSALLCLRGSRVSSSLFGIVGH